MMKASDIRLIALQGSCCIGLAAAMFPNWVIGYWPFDIGYSSSIFWTLDRSQSDLVS